ncbi:hypothetical protein SpiGrapes_2338 [Sphaerochaeta pleomorpha str. Grapes]|uniref:Uncharacterized protein n=1 Tax=Sphaerochaeta pleomorpha (strain ATCC BAA-1885 / DSM 22778 / Grapes) TaxID=158190 RepID=G8QST1_SPHPG|nr:hypothetical protein SpiGrapes_2338 [Sphaerochaeta pleomorpha str. Grapes]
MVVLVYYIGISLTIQTKVAGFFTTYRVFPVIFNNALSFSHYENPDSLAKSLKYTVD